MSKTTITCTRRLQFCAGHRVPLHESKCRHLHGHNYVVFFHATAKQLDGVGRVIDFGVLKERLGGWIDEQWDHGLVMQESDPAAQAVSAAMIAADPELSVKLYSTHQQKLYIIPEPPTAENMAAYLLRMVSPQLLEGTGVAVTKVVLWETENCYATAELNAAELEKML